MAKFDKIGRLGAQEVLMRAEVFVDSLKDGDDMKFEVPGVLIKDVEELRFLIATAVDEACGWDAKRAAGREQLVRQEYAGRAEKLLSYAQQMFDSMEQ